MWKGRYLIVPTFQSYNISMIRKWASSTRPFYLSGETDNG